MVLILADLIEALAPIERSDRVPFEIFQPHRARLGCGQRQAMAQNAGAASLLLNLWREVDSPIRIQLSSR